MQSKEGSVKINAVKNAQYDFLLIEGPGLVKVSIFNNVLSYKEIIKDICTPGVCTFLRLLIIWVR